MLNSDSSLRYKTSLRALEEGECDSYRVLFCGTSDFGLPVLKVLVASQEFSVVGVVTQPDRPVGRKQKLTSSDIKKYILENDLGSEIDIFQPEVLRKEVENILEIAKPDIIITASYGQIIPKVMLEYPKYKCLNIHGSLLPVLRGAVPVQRAILDGFDITGVSIQIMSESLDAGDVIASEEIKIQKRETSGELLERLSVVAADLILPTLKGWVSGQIVPLRQNAENATYCYMSDIAKDKAQVDFSENTIQFDRKLRGFYPWPIVWCELVEKNKIQEKYIGKRCKIYRGSVVCKDYGRSAGSFIKVDGRIHICLKDGAVLVEEMQVEGGARRDSSDYLHILEE